MSKQGAHNSHYWQVFAVETLPAAVAPACSPECTEEPGQFLFICQCFEWHGWTQRSSFIFINIDITIYNHGIRP